MYVIANSYDGAVVDETCEDTEFQDEMKGTRTTLDKKTGEGKETDIAERAENKKEVYLRIYKNIYVNTYRMICLKWKKQGKGSSLWP